MDGQPSRDALGRWLPGCPPTNPAGRPRNAVVDFAAACRAAVGNGQLIIETMLLLLRGDVDGCRAADRHNAAEWFADRGWGRALQIVELDGTNELTIRVVRVDAPAKLIDVEAVDIEAVGLDTATEAGELESESATELPAPESDPPAGTAWLFTPADD